MALARLSAAALSAIEEYYETCRAAEGHRAQEAHAAIILQSVWRGCLQRKEMQKLSYVALTIQRCWRGYRGRQRFASARAAHNRQLREAYFSHQATVIQRCWRGYFSRSRIHDFHKRKAYLSAVASANAAVRAGMQAELQQALQHQQHTAESAAHQHFNAQVSRLHHMTSTMSIPGIFNPPAALEVPTVAGVPLEQHLRTAGKQQASRAVRNQQTAMRHTVGSYLQTTPAFQFPGGSLASRQSSMLGAESVPAKPVDSFLSSAAASGGNVKSSACACNGNSGGLIQGTRVLQSAGKLASLVVAAVDDEYNARADPNMPDGTFNPGLTLQQSAGFEAVRQACELERRINRGLMLTTHGGQPFDNISKPPSQESLSHSSSSLQPSPVAAAALAAAAAARKLEGRVLLGHAIPGQIITAGSSQHWKHNKFPGGFFDLHMKQAY